MTAYSTAPFSPAEISAEGLKPEEYDDIVQRLGRHPNRAELGMFGVMWSEHCCYKRKLKNLGRPFFRQHGLLGFCVCFRLFFRSMMLFLNRSAVSHKPSL